MYVHGSLRGAKGRRVWAWPQQTTNSIKESVITEVEPFITPNLQATCVKESFNEKARC